MLHLARADGGGWVVVAPVEPVVFDNVDWLQAGACGFAFGGAALEIPFVTGCRVH